MPKLVDLSQSPRPVPQDVGGIVNIPTVPTGEDAIGRGLTQLGSGITGAGDQMFQAQKVEEDRINTLRAEEAFTQLREKQLDLTVGDEGFSKVRGAAAVSKPLYQEWGAKFQDAQQQISSGLSNADQRDKFVARANVARLQFHEDMLRHLSRESDTYAKEVYSSILSTEQGNAIARWDDPNSMAASIVRIDAAVDREGERAGWAEGDIAATKQAQASAIYRGVIGMMTSNAQERKAQDFYDQVKSKLTAGDQLAVQSTLERARKQIEDDTWEGVADGIQQLEHQVFMDPAQYEESYQSGKDTIDGLKDVQERNRVKYRHSLYERLATAKVLGQARTDPEGTEAMLRGEVPKLIDLPEGWTTFGGSTKNITGMVQAGNIDLSKRVAVRNPDGSVSTVRSMNFEEDGTEVLIPTVVNGKVVSDQEAIDEYHRTGAFLGKFSSPEAAEAYAGQLHQQQARMYAPGEATRVNLEAYAAQQEKIYSNIPPGLLRAVIEKESEWDPKARSKKGAIGLGQLLPTTAAGEGVDPEDPYGNIRGAASYLSKQLTRFNGNVALALAAYNAGPDAVIKHGGIPPFKETQAYVPDVQARAEIYAQQGDAEILPTMVATNTGDDFIDKMPLHLRMQLAREVGTMVNQGQAKARHALKAKVEDFTAMANSSVDIPLSSIPTQSEVMRAYGSVDGQRMWKEVQDSLALNQDIKQIVSMPRAEQDQLFSSRGPTPGPGYLDAFKRQNALGRAIDAVRKEQDADPAGWTQRNTQAVRQAWNNAQEALATSAAQPDDQIARQHATQALGDYALTTMAEQDRIGMAPKLLPNDVAESVVQSFYKGQKEGGQNAAQLVSVLSEQWGKYWPQVYKEIAKQIPSAARTIGAGMPEAAAMRLAQLADVKTEDLKTGLASTDVTAIHEQLVSNFDKGHISLVATNGRSGEEAFTATYRDAEKLALSYRAQGKSNKEAANQAYDETFGHRYDFVSSGPAYYRVPKGGPDWQRPNTINAGATVVQSNIANLDIKPPVSVSGLKPQEALDQYKAVIASKGYWVTDENESGLVLMNPQGNPVLDTHNKPIQRSWYELYTASKGAAIGGTGPVGPGGGTIFPTSPEPVTTPPAEPAAAASEPPQPPLPVEKSWGGETARGVLPMAKEITSLERPPAVPVPPRKGSKYTREYTPDGEPVVDTFPPGERPKFKQQDFGTLEKRLRSLAAREEQAGQLAAQARDSNDKDAWLRRTDILNQMFKDRQDLLQKLRKLDPKRADQIYNDLYLK